MKVKTSILIDEDLWLKFRVECVKRKLKASQEIENLIKKRLKEFE
jgi:hypothetical protein